MFLEPSGSVDQGKRTQNSAVLTGDDEIEIDED